ncbi:type II toxin-antitoxin system HicB family antitoxin [bacterium]|nr:type II toxin-antitoxin system HicB family antitoxin [bacterium]MBU1614747.1 type II toxin-antitoxin system HicB family antitoxin [bacterium]
MATMKYGDYVAAIEFDPDIDMFFGNVVNLSNPVTFYGKSTDELKREFEKSIQVYLDVCKERGIQVEKPYSGYFNIQMTPQQHRHFAKACSDKKQESERLGDRCA